MSPSRKKPKSQAEIELSHATVCRAIQKGPCPIQGQRQSVRKYPWPILQNLTSITVYKSTYLHTYTQLTLVIPVVPGYNTLLKNSCLKEAEMRSSVIVMSIVAVGLSMGARDANAARIVTADETTGQVPSDFSFLTDSIRGLLCSANEDVTACFAGLYTVDSSYISPAFQAIGGFAGVDLWDRAGSDTPGNLSDQLYLKVTPVFGAGD